jgi:transcriptional regulator with XRE-family HTH domain
MSEAHLRTMLASNVRASRAAHNMTREQVFVRSGVIVRTLANVENLAGPWPQMQTLLKLADVFGVSFLSFFVEG